MENTIKTNLESNVSYIAAQRDNNGGSQSDKETFQDGTGEKLTQARALIADVRATTKQPNVSNCKHNVIAIKQGLPKLEIIDCIEFMHKSRAKTSEGPSIFARVSQRPRAYSAPDVGKNKRVATSPPQPPKESLKRPRQEATTTETKEWTEVAKKMKKKNENEKPAKKETKLPLQEKKKPGKTEGRLGRRTKPDAIPLKPTQMW